MGGEKWMRVRSAHTCPKHIMCRGALLIFAENSIKLHWEKKPIVPSAMIARWPQNLLIYHKGDLISCYRSSLRSPSKIVFNTPGPVLCNDKWCYSYAGSLPYPFGSGDCINSTYLNFQRSLCIIFEKLLLDIHCYTVVAHALPPSKFTSRV